MPSDARQDPLEEGVRFARLNAAAALVGKRNDPVHVREIASEFFEWKFRFDILRCAGGTIHTGNHRHIIACANASARARVTEEAANVRRPHGCQWTDVGAKLIVPREIAGDQIVGMDVVTADDFAAGKANHLAVATHWRALRHGADGQFVALG